METTVQVITLLSVVLGVVVLGLLFSIAKHLKNLFLILREFHFEKFPKSELYKKKE